MIRVLIAEDNAVVRRGIVQVLQKRPGLEVVGEAENGAATLQLIKGGLKADVLLTDLNMPEMDGLQLVEHIAELGLNLPAVMLTMHVDTAFMEKALATGVRGYLLKNGDMDELADGITNVHRGKLVIGKEFRH